MATKKATAKKAVAKKPTMAKPVGKDGIDRWTSNGYGIKLTNDKAPKKK